MPQFEKVLVFQDAFSNSTSAIEFAISVVEGNHAKLCVVDVIPELSAIWNDFVEDEHQESSQQMRLRRVRAKVDSLCGPDHAIEVSTLEGRRSIQLIKEVTRGNYDLLVKEAHSTAADAFFGSSDTRLVRQCPVPVAITTPSINRKIAKRVLVAVNPEEGEFEMRQNIELIKQASKIAISRNSELFVVAAIEPPFVTFAHNERALARCIAKEKRVINNALIRLEQLSMENATNFDVKNIRLEIESPETLILRTAEELESELLVLGCIGRAGISGFLIGSTTEQVMRSLTCPLLAIRHVESEAN